MKITLPQRSDGQSPSVVDSNACTRRIVIIGANGTGKTRFTNSLVADLGSKAYCLSALHALYSKRPVAASQPDGKPGLRDIAAQRLGNGRDDKPATELEMLLQLLMHDEMVNLIGYKLAAADSDSHTPPRLRPTKLDKVIELWQEVFPSNRVLIESGKILFGRGLDDDAYSAVRLSDGERAVLYHAGAVLYAPRGAVIFVESPELFLHPTLTSSLWNRLEFLRTDCTFCYTTHDPEFASSRNGAAVVWVRECDNSASGPKWDYDILPEQSELPADLYMTLTGARKPVLFIEGDGVRSIDAKLYPLIFPDFTVRSLGSCNKVIESTRTFNDLQGFHKMDSFGIVDRDRRDEHEVAYLRRKRVMVPEVAEVENILLLEDVVKAMAEFCHKIPDKVFAKVKKTIVSLFSAELHQQALLHTRHKVKRMMEYRVDARFADIGTLEKHISGLVDEINPRGTYEKLCREFQTYAKTGDYEAILKVYNQKSMLISSNIAPMCGYKNKDEYISGVIALLRSSHPGSERVKTAVKRCLGIEPGDSGMTPAAVPPSAE